MDNRPIAVQKLTNGCACVSKNLGLTELSGRDMANSAPLRNQRVDVEFGKLQDTPCSDLISRDRRAHRRFSWSERMQRNACPSGCIPEYRVYGVSKSLAAHLGGAIQSAN